MLTIEDSVSDLYEVMSWMVYGAAAVMLLSAVVAVLLAGLALRFAAEFVRQFVGGREEDGGAGQRQKP